MICIDPLNYAIRTMPYKIRIGNRVLEYDPKAGRTKLVESLPLDKPKVWYKDEQGQCTYGLARDLQHPPSK